MTTHPIPPGTRDVLPEEMAELRQLEGAILGAFARHGYGEIATPTIEYDAVLDRADPIAAASAYRFFDEAGALVTLRPDMTIPIARVAATRYAHATGPLRLCYCQPTFRMVRPQQGQQREFTQAGVELLGPDAPHGTAEVVEVLCAALDAAGLPRARIGLGDADLYRQLLTELGVPADACARVLHELATRDLAGLEREVDELGLGEAEREVLVRVPTLRGGRDALDEARESGVDAAVAATARIAATLDALSERGLSERVIVDLGLLRDLGYYTGAILEVYDPAIGHVIGGGGRYDELLGRFGHHRPAAGFCLYLERVHVARAEEDRLMAEAEAQTGKQE